MENKRSSSARNDNVSKLDEKERKKLAKQYSEGLEELEQLLNNLWNLGIDTLGCCRGHNDKLPYIGIVVNDYSINIINHLMIKFLNDNSFSDKVIIALGYNSNFGLDFSLSFKQIDNNNFSLISDNLIENKYLNCYLEQFMRLIEEYNAGNYFSDLVFKDYDVILHIYDQFMPDLDYACCLDDLIEDSEYNSDLYENIKGLFCYCDHRSLKKLIDSLEKEKIIKKCKG